MYPAIGAKNSLLPKAGSGEGKKLLLEPQCEGKDLNPKAAIYHLKKKQVVSRYIFNVTSNWALKYNLRLYFQR